MWQQQQKMKQFQLEQVKFPKMSSTGIQRPVPSESRKAKSSAHSQMLRIIIALLIAIFIYNSSQQTTINYKEIIKNQKMFLVKNIRGVLPTLSGNTRQLQRTWKVVHFQNFIEKDSELFNNYTFTFNKTRLVIENIYCNFSLTYDWKNYSYNIDLKDLQPSQAQAVNANELKSSGNDKADHQGISNQIAIIIDPNVKPSSQSEIITSIQSESKATSLQNSKAVSVNSQTATKIPIQTIEPEQHQKQQKCDSSRRQLKDGIKFTSVWTISDKNLYLLLENTNLQQDFYLILQPLVI